MNCRLCLCNITPEQASPLFCSTGETEFVKLIAKYLLLEVTEHDCISTNICNDCAVHLINFDRYCIYVYERQSTLPHEYYEVKCLYDSSEEMAAEAPIEHNEESLLEIKSVCIEPAAQILDAAERLLELKSSSGADDITNEIHESLSPIASKKPGLDVKYDCLVCGKQFSCKTILKYHSLKHQAKRKYSCQRCGKILPSKNRLNKHMQNAHDNISHYVCDYCGLKFKTKPSFAKHVAEHLGKLQPPVQCRICGEWFKLMTSLRDHMREHKELDVVCEVCGRVCPTHVALVSHIRYNHQKQYNLQCSFCDKTFKIQQTLEEHMTIHTGEKRNVCPYCSKQYRGKSYMYVHIKRKHVEEWNKKKKLGHTSLETQEPLSQASIQDIEDNQHSTEDENIVTKSNFKCKICGRCFSRKYGLTQHVKRHNEVGLQCPQCGRPCPTPVALRAHIRYAHKCENNLKCNFCEKTFKVRSNLQEHMSIHTGEKHNPCPHCPKEYRSKANMYVHIKKEHFEEWSRNRFKTRKLQTAETN